jgi:hypothetical protein
VTDGPLSSIERAVYLSAGFYIVINVKKILLIVVKYCPFV